MGVNGLWKLLNIAGKNVNIDSLAGRRVAVDVSIWLTQFIKAMRDQDGNPIPNSHLIGMFRHAIACYVPPAECINTFTSACVLIASPSTPSSGASAACYSIG